MNSINFSAPAMKEIDAREADAPTVKLPASILPEPSLLFPLSASEDQKRPLPDLTLPDPKNLPQGSSRYKIERFVAEGGFGSVFAARDLLLGRQVALKILKTTATPDAAAELLREALILARLEHPNILPIYDSGVTPKEWEEQGITPGQLYVVMKFIQGKTLHELISAGSAQLTIFRRLQLFLDICRAVGFAHDRGAVHRDLKPQNVMIEERSKTVLVLDWGLALIFGIRDPLEGKIVGTLAYMSPEQAQGQEVDHRTDLYALGAILFEMLSGQAPFVFAKGQDFWSCQKYMLEHEPPELQRLNSEIPEELSLIVKKAMAKNPKERFENAAEFEKAILSFLEGTARKDKAKKCLEEAKRLQQLTQDLEGQLGQKQEKLTKLKGEIPRWKPFEEKKPIRDLEDRITTLQRIIDNNRASVNLHLNEALRHDPDNAQVHQLLADIYKQELEKAEKEEDTDRVALYRELLQVHDKRGLHAEWHKKGDGVLTLDSNPTGAAVFFSRYVEKDRRLVPTDEQFLGRTPLQEVSLPQGSYLLTLYYRRDNKETQSALASYNPAGRFRTVRYPVHISRGSHWNGGCVNLYTEGEIEAGIATYIAHVSKHISSCDMGEVSRVLTNILQEGYFCYVPAGPFLTGGASFSPTAKAQKVMELPDFFIARYPVTCAEYLAFLNDLLRQAYSSSAIEKRAPRSFIEGPLWPLRFDDLSGKDSFILPQPFSPLLPVTGISWDDAVSFCRWFSNISGLQAGLPSEWEWEKASGGVDGRRYPWGNAEEPTFANCWDAFEPGKARLLPINEFPKEDESVYGVRGCAGGVSDLTGSVFPDDADKIIARGGSWRHDCSTCNIRYIMGNRRKTTADTLGFRLCHRPNVR